MSWTNVSAPARATAGLLTRLSTVPKIPPKVSDASFL
eukprot:CAMPEP_0184439756 /NCGR_PEP_ID=MMETSP0738-20130409/729019_1 /TAXON_ID=385413 /ORGANISM="Thalassiosira miniscula, Strain CCMP1093" /LENGTH=36 /DNA_ID= /DNA_START= /DNA_END= /DNA_ORIENTATION=